VVEEAAKILKQKLASGALIASRRPIIAGNYEHSSGLQRLAIVGSHKS
jgi:hypothetical protein